MKRYLFLSVLGLFIVNCGGGPKITVCVSDPKKSGFDCFNENTGKSLFVKYDDSDKYVAMPPNDAQAMFNFCNQPSK